MSCTSAEQPHRRGFRTTDLGSRKAGSLTDYWAITKKDVYYYSYSIIQIGKRPLFYENF